MLFKAPIRLQLPGRRRRSPGNLDRYLTVDKLRQLGFVADSGTVVDCQCRDAGVDITAAGSPTVSSTRRVTPPGGGSKLGLRPLVVVEAFVGEVPSGEVPSGEVVGGSWRGMPLQGSKAGGPNVSGHGLGRGLGGR